MVNAGFIARVFFLLLILGGAVVGMLYPGASDAKRYLMDFTFELVPLPEKGGESWLFGQWENRSEKGVKNIDRLTVQPDGYEVTGSYGPSRTDWRFLGVNGSVALFGSVAPRRCFVEGKSHQCAQISALASAVVTSSGSGFVEDGQNLLLFTDCGLYVPWAEDREAQLKAALTTRYSCADAWQGSPEFWQSAKFFVRITP